VAPSDEMSGVSHGLTLNNPLRVRQTGPDNYMLNGTPADCILVAMNKVLDSPPDLVVSGINAGLNLGDDVMYSGTVAAAREGSVYDVPAIAFSLKSSNGMDYEKWSEKALTITRHYMNGSLPSQVFLNVNFPMEESNGVKITRLSRKCARSKVHEKTDPRGKKYFWIGLDHSSWEDSTETDHWAIAHGFISITPLHRDQTSYQTIQDMKASYEKI